MSFHIPCHSKMRFEEARTCVETGILAISRLLMKTLDKKLKDQSGALHSLFFPAILHH